jgi:hypothetical protein
MFNPNKVPGAGNVESRLQATSIDEPWLDKKLMQRLGGHFVDSRHHIDGSRESLRISPEPTFRLLIIVTTPCDGRRTD